MKPGLLLALMLALSTVLSAQSHTPASSGSAAQVFSYDAKAALDFQEKSEEAVKGVKGA